MAATMTLSGFLLVRIQEDERAALYAQTRDDVQPEDWGGWWLGHYQHYSRYSPARVLAECEARARILRLHIEGEAWCDFCEPPGGHPDHCPTLRALALPYADHAGYREEWRP